MCRFCASLNPLTSCVEIQHVCKVPGLGSMVACFLSSVCCSALIPAAWPSTCFLNPKRLRRFAALRNPAAVRQVAYHCLASYLGQKSLHIYCMYMLHPCMPHAVCLLLHFCSFRLCICCMVYLVAVGWLLYVSACLCCVMLPLMHILLYHGPASPRGSSSGW